VIIPVPVPAAVVGAVFGGGRNRHWES